jgi:hypothetical protein
MKIAERQHNVKIEGDVSVNEFGFVFNAKMVQLLSDNLYNNKILAIVREISTNAWDSHVEAGTQDKPFDVHLPTYSEPYFYVRDYGTGMSPERVDTVYRFYGASDRTDSNEFTGGMGLGSKVPFCYNTHTFTVDSWCDGVHTCYSCFIGENGKPNIATMSQSPSSVKSGVMIKLHVNVGDCSNFKYAAERIYPIFPVMPNFTGSSIPRIIKPKYSLSANNGEWRLREATDEDGCRVIMGNVAYPVKINDANITSSQRAVIESDFDLFANVGTMSVDISREGLSYDNRTRTRIANMLDQVVVDYTKRIQEEIDKCDNLWNARKKFVELHDKAELRIMDGSKIKYNGTQLFDRSGYHHVKLEQLTNTIRDPQTKSVISTPVVNITAISIGWRAKYEKDENVNTIAATSNVRFFEHDLTIGAFVRAAEVARQHKCSVLLFKFNDSAARKAVADAIGCEVTDFPPISDVPSPTVRGSSYKRGTYGRVLKFDTRIVHNNHSNTIFWIPEQKIDFASGSGIYVEFNRFSYRHNNGHMYGPQELAKTVSLARNCGITIPDIFGIKTADLKHIKGNAKFVNFFDWLTKEVAAILPKLNIDKIKHYQEKLSKVCLPNYQSCSKGKSRLTSNVVAEIASLCQTNNDFTEFAKLLDDVKVEIANGKSADNMKVLATKIGVTIPIYPKFAELELDKIEARVYNKYTMLGFVDTEVLGSHVGLKTIANYIDSVS